MNIDRKSKFAVFFGNRGCFPASLQQGARRQMSAALEKFGYDAITMNPRSTRYGAVETYGVE